MVNDIRSQNEKVAAERVGSIAYRPYWMQLHFARFIGPLQGLVTHGMVKQRPLAYSFKTLCFVFQTLAFAQLTRSSKLDIRFEKLNKQTLRLSKYIRALLIASYFSSVPSYSLHHEFNPDSPCAACKTTAG
jgi:hypothetical protein